MSGRSDRGVRMEGRLVRTLEEAGFGENQIDPILRSHRTAMDRRRELLDDDHHFAFLHPGRTVLVAVTDAGVRDPSLLALAPLIDSLHPWMAGPAAIDSLEVLHPLPLSGLAEPPVSIAPLADLAGSAGAGADRPPSTDPDTRVPAETSEMLEHLIALDAEPLALVLAEALDHLRHLHLSDDPDLPGRVAERTREVLLPLAERAGGTLNRRYRWWWRRVGRGMRDGE